MTLALKMSMTLRSVIAIYNASVLITTVTSFIIEATAQDLFSSLVNSISLILRSALTAVLWVSTERTWVTAEMASERKQNSYSFDLPEGSSVEKETSMAGQ